MQSFYHAMNPREEATPEHRLRDHQVRRAGTRRLCQHLPSDRLFGPGPLCRTGPGSVTPLFPAVLWLCRGGNQQGGEGNLQGSGPGLGKWKHP